MLIEDRLKRVAQARWRPGRPLSVGGGGERGAVRPLFEM
jgi:hypothetical protein